MGKKGKKNKRLNEVAVEVMAKEPKTTKAQVATNFKLTIPRDVYQKIMHWINKSNFEVSGFGSLDYDPEENEFIVRDVILLKQEVGSASTEIDPIALNRAMYQMRDEPNALKWHWHSHVNMQVFWSNDDMEIIRSLGQQDWILASVFNKREEIKTAFLTTVQVMGKPHDVFVDDIRTEICFDALTQEVQDQLDAEYNAMVTLEKVAVPSQFPGRGSVHGYSPSTLPVANEDRWAPQGPGLTATDYDEHGYVFYDNELLYNPCFDKQLVDELDRLEAVDEMAPKEIEIMTRLSPSFQTLVYRYYGWKAREGQSYMDGYSSYDDEELEELNTGVKK